MWDLSHSLGHRAYRFQMLLCLISCLLNERCNLRNFPKLV